MKPRNEREREVVRLSGKLNKSLTDAQVLWFVDKVVPHKIYTTGKRCWCTACGHAFTANSISGQHECPNCHRVGVVEESRKRVNADFKYLQIITTANSWQVIRYFLVKWESRCGGNLRLDMMPVLEKWCRPGQPTITLGCYLKMAPSWQRIPYSEYSELSVKGMSYFQSEWMEVTIYPRKKILPVYHKCGYADKWLSVYSAEELFGIIFSNPMLESLFKAGKKDELEKRMNVVDWIWKNWDSLRVALRHGFDPWKEFKYVGNYYDYISMLKFLHKDVRNPYYVAPKNWDDMHSRICEEAARKRKQIAEKREQREALRRALLAEEKLKREKAAKNNFARRIKKYAGLLIVGDGMTIAPLMTIQDFFDEGQAMHHCVFSNGYYKKPDSLILSAKDVNGKRIETVEVDLRKWAVVQSHGVNNSYTPKHDCIVSLVTENMPSIQSLSGRKVASE